MNYVIPILGDGKRFVGYKEYKPFIKINGKAMIEKVIEPLISKPDNKVYIFCKYEYEDKFNKLFNNPRIKITPLRQTIGAGETLKLACEYLLKNESFTSIDCDTIINKNTEDIINSVNNNCVFYFKDELKIGIFSYIELNGNVIKNIAEKEPISNNASSGIYQFKSPEDYLKSYSEELKYKNELYISNVIKNSINKGNTYLAYDITGGFDIVGTPHQLKEYIKKNQEKKIFVFDLDKTIIYDTLENQTPILKNIETINSLYDKGHKIIIHTARGMLSHNGDIEAIIKTYYYKVKYLLRDLGVKYHELIFGKPYGDFYIDDKAISALDNISNETGVYISEKLETRFSNDVYELNGNICKKGNCIENELYYYNNIPNNIKKYFPNVLTISNEDTLVMEKIDGDLFSDLLVSYKLTEYHINKLIEALNEIHVDKNIKPINDWYYGGKLIERYLQNESIYLMFGISKKEILDLINKVEIKETSIIHGDTVFTNVFIDKSNNIKLIDARGCDNNGKTIYGATCYDYAKILQSLYGYDYILKGSVIPIDYLTVLRNHFLSVCGINSENLKTKTKILILSMMPLHTDKTDRINKYFEMYKSIK